MSPKRRRLSFTSATVSFLATGADQQLNGCVHHTFPKKQSFLTVNQKALAALAQKLNRMHRKYLGFQMPQEVFDAIRARRPPHL